MVPKCPLLEVPLYLLYVLIIIYVHTKEEEELEGPEFVAADEIEESDEDIEVSF